MFIEDRALYVNESGNQEGSENTFFTPALAHKFVRTVFRIQTKDFSDILNDSRAPSLKQNANCRYFRKRLISRIKHFTPDWTQNVLLLEMFSTHSSSPHCKEKKTVNKVCWPIGPIGTFLILLTLYIGYPFKSLILIY